MRSSSCNSPFHLSYLSCVHHLLPSLFVSSRHQLTDSSPAKNAVLADSASLLSLRMGVIPRIIMALITSCWCDRFPSGRRIVLLLSIAGQLVSTLALLLTSLAFGSDQRWILVTGVPAAFASGYLLPRCHYGSRGAFHALASLQRLLPSRSGSRLHHER